ncbi:uncharacterized protein LACBIDRAFT_293312 [Laccaria bicolor S238N-H82]|uniref:Predicted protein n=1 Tax=Laccaria bicolor (strain S238N-H82 / ATCC MYA-4686) TaxID=486041 RepID=B0D2V6_LACBS|nr:uncharacterized protein LACBIDRAFT_293312 [Laccaria bicolor S238N-H82]EDR10819.1 predicted protein [Laccaria bicolor S238N-H82]|eukprot:XP_001878120.1 predicted protein [Laccaria bicolor S238N-H82]
MRPTHFTALVLFLSQLYFGTALPTNRHELIAKRGDLTEPVVNRAVAPSVDFYPRGGADDLDTRELEEFWLIARGPKPRPLPVPPPPPPPPRPLPPVPVQNPVQAPAPRPAYASRPLPLAKGKAKVRNWPRRILD